jgi:hypothetical protein
MGDRRLFQSGGDDRNSAIAGLANKRHHHDRRLLLAVCQRGQQPSLSCRIAHAQMPPAARELMKHSSCIYRLNVR